MEKEEKVENIVYTAVSGASAETVQRFGTAVKEHVVAYTGQDNEAGTQLKKSLKKIAEEKVNPDYYSQNIKQQAGFSAEVKETANVNAAKIIRGDTSRKIRTDDLGRVNDPLYDHVEIDASGKIIAGSASQMKFVGSTPPEALDKLVSKEFAKYLENDVKIVVPSDYYDGILQEADSKIVQLNRQLNCQLEKGNYETADQLRAKIKSYQTVKNNLRSSTVSNDEALFARLHPNQSTVKSVASVSHQAGLETAKYGAVIGGSVSIIQNIVALTKGEEDTQQAIVNVAKGTASAAAVGYGTSFVGSSIKGIMQNASAQSVQALSKTNLPGVIVTASVNAAKTMGRYFNGEISGIECFEELGEGTTSMISSALFSTIGQIAIPIPVIGGLIGSMVGYAIASASYGLLVNSMKEAKLAHEERIRIEEACAQQIELIKAYRKDIEMMTEQYLTSHIASFHQAFSDMKTALQIGDVDGLIASSNAIANELGKEALFRNQSEFDALMNSREPIKF